MLTSLLLAIALAGAAPQSVAPTGQPSPATTGTHPVPKVSKGRKPHARTVTKPPLTTATGTTTPKPSNPAGTVPPGAPGTSDPTMPGSPPH